MPRFSIDVTLPRPFHLWATSEFEFAHDAEPSWSDAEIWDFALARNLVIITVDGDFHDRRILENSGPKIIHLRLRNMRLRDWHPFVTSAWPKIVSLIEQRRMVVVYRDRIDAVPQRQTGCRVIVSAIDPIRALHAAMEGDEVVPIELWGHKDDGTDKKQVYVLPKHLDEKVAALHLEKLGAMLTKMTEERAADFGVKPTGPFEAHHDRY